MTEQQKEIVLHLICDAVHEAATAKENPDQAGLNQLAESIAEAVMAGYKKFNSGD